MRIHPLEAKIKAFIDSLDHQPTFAEFMDHFKSDSELIELMVISSLYLDYDPSGIVKDVFANSKDSEKIEELMDKYGDYDELSDLFIPKNVMAAALYKDNKNIEKAQALVEFLVESFPQGYLNDLYTIKNLIFDGDINLEITDCEVDYSKLIALLNESIKNQKVNSFSDEENALNVENFYFYRLNNFFSIVDTEQIKEVLKKYEEEAKLSFTPITKFSTFVSGNFKPQGVYFKINLRGIDNLFKGLTTRVKVQTSLKDIAKNVAGNLAKDAVSNIVVDYLQDKIPLVREIKMGKEVLNAIVNSSLEMTDISSIVKELDDHRTAILELKIPLKDYYINHYLATEFKTFFKEQDLDYVHEDMKALYERLYNTFVQSINVVLTPEMEQQFLKSQGNEFDKETKRFLAVCQSVLEARPKTRLKLASQSL